MMLSRGHRIVGTGVCSCYSVDLTFFLLIKPTQAIYFYTGGGAMMIVFAFLIIIIITPVSTHNAPLLCEINKFPARLSLRLLLLRIILRFISCNSLLHHSEARALEIMFDYHKTPALDVDEILWFTV